MRFSLPPHFWARLRVLSLQEWLYSRWGGSGTFGNRAIHTRKIMACLRAYSVVSHSLQPHGQQPARLLCPQDFPGENTAVGCQFLLQGAFPTQGSNLHAPQLCADRSLYRRATREAPGWQQLFPDSLGGDGECALHGNLYPGGIQGPPLPLGIAYFLKPPISGVTATWNGQPRSSPGQHPSGPLFWNQSQA